MLHSIQAQRVHLWQLEPADDRAALPRPAIVDVAARALFEHDMQPHQRTVGRRPMPPASAPRRPGGSSPSRSHFRATTCSPACHKRPRSRAQRPRATRAKAPLGLADGRALGPTLVTEALPIEPQARRFQRRGVPSSANTQGRSIGSLLGQLITARLEEFNGTGLRVLDPTAVQGIHRDMLWVMVGDSRWVRFAALRTGDVDAIVDLPPRSSHSALT